MSDGPLRIAVVAGKFPALAETFVSRQVIELRRLGHVVDVYSSRRGRLPEGAPAELVELASQVRVRPGRGPSGLWRAARVLARPGLAARLLNGARYGKDATSLRLLFAAEPWLGQGSYDAVLAHFAPNANVVAKLRDAGVLRGGGGLVAFLHGSDIAGAKPGELDFLFAHGDRLVAVSEALASRAVALGASRERVSVVYNGVDTAWFSPGPARAEDGVVRLVTVARLVPVKGLEHAIDAVAKLPDGVRARVRYDIVGDGELKAPLQERIGRAGLGAVVTLRGALAPEGVREALRRSDVFVFPSVSEGLGIAAIEAMACGLPVVGSSVGGIPEVVADGETGLLVQAGDPSALGGAILKMVEDVGMRRAMGGAGRRRACAVFDGRRQLERVVDAAREAADAARAGWKPAPRE